MVERLIACDDLVRVIAEFLPRKVCRTVEEVESWLDSGFPYEKIVFIGESSSINDWLRLLSSKSLKLRRLRELAIRLSTDEELCHRMVQALNDDRFVHLKRLVISAQFQKAHKLRKCLQRHCIRPGLALDMTFQLGKLSTVADLRNLPPCQYTDSGKLGSLRDPSKRVFAELCMVTTTVSCSRQSAPQLLSGVQRCFVSLQSLNLPYSDLGDQEISKLSSALQSSRCRLMQLELQGNKITADGAAAIAKALKHNRKLKTLRLDCNRLGPSGGTVIADSLIQNRSLRELHLQFNCLGQAGRNAISSALQLNSCIRRCYYYD